MRRCRLRRSSVVCGSYGRRRQRGSGPGIGRRWDRIGGDGDHDAPIAGRVHQDARKQLHLRGRGDHRRPALFRPLSPWRAVCSGAGLGRCGHSGSAGAGDAQRSSLWNAVPQPAPDGGSDGQRERIVLRWGRSLRGTPRFSDGEARFIACFARGGIFAGRRKGGLKNGLNRLKGPDP